MPRIEFCTASWRVVAAMVALAIGLAAAPAGAATDLCRRHAEDAERRNAIPDGLLGAIALAETGRWDEAAGESRAWPWTVMALGEGTYHPTRQSALDHVAWLHGRGVTNIDVGCMQVNLGYHGHRFASVADAIDPVQNVAYAARFLIEKHAAAESWIEAASHYHSMTPHLSARYRAKVERLWAGLTDTAPASVGTWGADVAQTRDGAATAPVQIDYDRTARLNKAFRSRRAEAAPAGAAAVSRATDPLTAWRAARAADSGFADGGYADTGLAGGGAASDGGPMASLNAANAARIAALIRRTERAAAERAALRDTRRTDDSFAEKRRADLAYWRQRYNLGG